MTSSTARVSSREHHDNFPWFPILMLGLSAFLGLAVELSPAGLLNAIAADLDVSLAAVGTLTTAFALGNALLVLPLTALAMRFSRRSVLVAVMGLFAVGNIVVAVAPSIAIADIGRFAAGAAFAVQCSLLPAVAVRIAGPKHGVRAMTIVLAANTLGTALGAPLASLLGMSTGWRMTFVVAAAIAAFVGVMFIFTVPYIRTVAEQRLPLFQAVRLPGVVRVSLAWALLMLGHFVVLTYIDAYLRELGVSAYVTSISLLVLGAGGIIGITLIGRLSKRSNYAALVVAPAAVAIALALIATGVSSLPVLLALIGLWGLGFSGTIFISQKALLLLGRKAPETATSIGILLAQFGFALGATVGGFVVSSIGLGFIPLVASAFVVAAVVVAASLRGVVGRAEVDEVREQAAAQEEQQPVDAAMPATA